MVYLLLLNLAGKEGLCLLDGGQDPGLALVDPLDTVPEDHLLCGGVRCKLPAQMKHDF